MATSRSSFAWLAVCALLIAASGAEAQRSLHQATAVSVANASGGGSSVVTSTSQATSTGAPTSATAVGTGTAGPGQTVVVDCNVKALDENLKKYCIGVPTSTSAATATAATTSWQSAPACKGSPVGTTVAKDLQGNPWGYEDGKSCAYRNGTAANTQAAQAIAAASATGATYETAPACAGDLATSYSVRDAIGRLWGYENGQSCVFRGAATAAATSPPPSPTSPPPSSPPAASPAPAKAQAIAAAAASG